LKEKEYIYPYLLRNLDIVRTDQVCKIEITYIPMKSGFIYITAIIDVFSRYIVGRGLSNYLNPENNNLELYKGLKKWIKRYHNRDHQEINKMKPNIIYYNTV